MHVLVYQSRLTLSNLLYFFHFDNIIEVTFDLDLTEVTIIHFFII